MFTGKPHCDHNGSQPGGVERVEHDVHVRVGGRIGQARAKLKPLIRLLDDMVGGNQDDDAAARLHVGKVGEIESTSNAPGCGAPSPVPATLLPTPLKVPCPPPALTGPLWHRLSQLASC